MLATRWALSCAVVSLVLSNHRAQEAPPAVAGRYAVMLRTDGAAQTRFLEELGELRRARAETGLAARIEARRAELLPRQAQLAAHVAARGAAVVEHGWLLDLVIVDGVSSALRDELALRTDVLAVQPIERRSPSLAKAMDANHHEGYAAHAVSVGGVPLKGSGQTLAILDSGLDLDMGGTGRPHAAFFANGNPLDTSGGGIDGSRVQSAQFVPYGGHTTSAEDLHGHGTRIASCAAGASWAALPDVGDASAPAASIRVYKIADDSPQYFGLTTADGLFTQLQKIVAQPDVFVANLSYDGWNDSTYFINPTMDAVVLAGVSMTASAGNYGVNLSFAHASYNVLVVGGSEEANFKPALFPFVSAVGPLPDGRRYPHIIAQGVGVTCARFDDESVSVDSNGCSAAAAIVAGSLSLLHQADPTLTPREARALLLNTTAKTIGNPNAAGWGYLKILPAVQATLANQVVSEKVQQGDVKRYPIALAAGVERSFTLVWDRTNVSFSFAAQPGFKANLDLELVDLATGQVVLASTSPVNLIEQVRITPANAINGELRVRAVTADQGTKFTSYALAGVDTLAVDDGFGCAGSALAIQSITPAAPPSLADGANLVTIHGCNLVPTPTLRLNGVPTGVTWSNVSSHTLTFVLPPWPQLGPLSIEIENANGVASTVVQVVAPAPLIRFGTTSSFLTNFIPTIPAQAYVGGTPGDIAFVGISGSLQPTYVPGIVDLAIGNGFYDFFLATAQPVPAQGWFQATYVFGPGLPAGTPVHFQAAFFHTSTGLLPLAVSPVTSGTLF